MKILFYPFQLCNVSLWRVEDGSRKEDNGKAEQSVNDNALYFIAHADGILPWMLHGIYGSWCCRVAD